MPLNRREGDRSEDDLLEGEKAVTQRFLGMIKDKGIIQDLQEMVERGVIRATGPIVTILVYETSSISTWEARPTHNVFKAKRNISLNTTVDKNRNTTKYGNKLEFCYSSVMVRNTRQTTTHNSHNRRPTTISR